MENPRTKAKRARKQRKEKEEEPAATGYGHPDKPGHPARPPKIRRPSQNAPEAEPSQPGHPARGPDIRLFPSRRTSGSQPRQPDPACPESNRKAPRPARTSGLPARTSDTCLCAEDGPRAHVSPSHLPLRGLALYILPHLLLVRVSVDLAHL